MTPIRLPWQKRFFDIFISLAAMIFFSFFFLIILLAMVLEMLFRPIARGGFFYSETRMSAGQPFKIYKFRVFKKGVLSQNINGDGIIHTKKLENNGHNLTFVGNILRRIYFDELPQLFNVLRGDMSMVGPRPTNLENMEKLLQAGHLSKFQIKAGLTGYFQSHKSSKYNLFQEEEDNKYIEFCRHHSGWQIAFYDLKIIFLTILTIFRAEGI